MVAFIKRLADEFQPTPSLRRATALGQRGDVKSQFQPTPSLRRATPLLTPEQMDMLISTHALLTEGDSSGHPYSSHSLRFQPTPSLRRATKP